jgi:hypothetical protein
MSTPNGYRTVHVRLQRILIPYPTDLLALLLASYGDCQERMKKPLAAGEREGFGDLAPVGVRGYFSPAGRDDNTAYSTLPESNLSS